MNTMSSADISLDIRRDKSNDDTTSGQASRQSSFRKGTVLDKLSSAETFYSKYEVIKEIGRGGFSKVYQCRSLETQEYYAVKMIDLRPLRLREGFDPTRLRREVDIMSRLKHPNIVGFVEGFETDEEVLMVLEYCPGKELFDVILERKSFAENDAKGVFAQVANALFYLHSLNIIHRDIKPENILVLDERDVNGELIVKLLDFGLSKNAGAGSEAKTFVGTPCYLSPEVEYTSKGLGGTYGLPADCWSLGAVLYVMLVARFPEFKQEPDSKKVVLKLPPALWSNISVPAKDLVNRLMDTNQVTRLTTGGALLHDWLGRYRSSPAELQAVAQACSALSEGLQASLFQGNDTGMTDDSQTTLTPGGFPVQQTEMVLRARQQEANTTMQNDDQLQLSPLFQLQRSVATCFSDAHASYQDIPEVATQVRQGAVLCRQQFTESTKMLYKIEQTASAVLSMFPDLELAVEEGEPKLASDFFNIVKGWVVELRSQVSATQQANQASMAQIQCIVESSTLSLQNRVTAKLPPSVKVPKAVLQLVQKGLTNGQEQLLTNMAQNDDDTVKLSGEQVLDFGPPEFHGGVRPRDRSGSTGSGSSGRDRSGSIGLNNNSSVIMEDVSMDEDMTNWNNTESGLDALQHLRQVDMILEQLATFWANTELVLDVLTKKGQHVEQLIGFGQKPKLFARFQERMGDYRRFWEGVQNLCKNYIHSAQGNDGTGAEDRTPSSKTSANARSNVERSNSEFDFMEGDSRDSVFREFISRNSAQSPPP
eukprot:GSChrysophyteH1.ASY1.ANO1.1367.1 assembled CDS